MSRLGFECTRVFVDLADKDETRQSVSLCQSAY